MQAWSCSLLSIRGNASTVAVDPASQIATVQPAEILGMVERISIDTRWRGRPIEGRRAGRPGGQNRLRRTRSSFLRCARNARSAGMGYLIDIGAAILLLASLSIAASFVPSKKALILTVGGIVAVVGAIVSDLHKAIELQPDSSWANFEIGRALLKTGDFKTAAVHLEIAANRMPEFSEVHALLAEAYDKLGRKDDGSRERAKAIQARGKP